LAACCSAAFCKANTACTPLPSVLL
jgi:hypothetical protein